jgi:threonine synthase
LQKKEGVFCEPASAASIAGLLKTNVPEGSTVVCVLTGNGLKDPDLAIRESAVPVVLDADEVQIRKHLEN